MANILYIENDISDFSKYKEFFMSQFPDVTVNPVKEREDDSLDSWAVLLKELRNNNDESFKKITDHFKNRKIDLYVVDISLNTSEDSFGVFFLNYLHTNGYIHNNFIVLSGHSFADATTNHLIDLNFGIEKETGFVEKGNYSKLKSLIKVKLDIHESNLIAETEDNTKSNSTNNSIIESQINKELMELTPRRILHWLITAGFFVLILLTLYYGLSGIWELLIVDDSSKETTKLINIESIFLYLLPLFVLFGFYEYYRQSTGALLNERNSGEYRPEKALISLNNSKNILLTTFLSFALIKGIEVIFFNKETNETTLISIGLFLLILMGFLIISHNNHGEK